MCRSRVSLTFYAPKGSMANFMLMNWAKLYKGTASELSIEPAIASLGIPYRFQHPFWSVHSIADFSFPTAKVILEVDGSEHSTTAGKKKDVIRTQKLNALGWEVIRCTNTEAKANPFLTIKRLVAKCPALARAMAEAKNNSLLQGI